MSTIVGLAMCKRGQEQVEVGAGLANERSRHDCMSCTDKGGGGSLQAVRESLVEGNYFMTLGLHGSI